MLDSREPPNGDFVAFVEKIEREQLARALQPHKLPHLTVGGSPGAPAAADDRSRMLSAGAAPPLQQPQARRKDGSASAVGPIIGAVIGAGLIAFGLMAEGGIILVLIGAVLLWHSLRRLRRRADPAHVSPGQQVEQVFGQKTSGTARGR
jgi:Flp pilus assembly protein TadB